MINYCKRCLYPEIHPLNLIIDDDGICSGCRVHEEKDTINFKERWLKLKKEVNLYKNKNSTNYDCIVPVNGGRDSFFIVDLIKNKLNLNPLIVNYNSHFNTPVGIRNLAKLRIKFGVDMIQKTISPEKIKKIVRSTIKNFGSVYWHVTAGETVYPVQMAVQLKIPLIIWGAHQGMEQVGMFSHYDYVEMTRKYRKDHDCMGFEAEDLLYDLDGSRNEISEEDILPLRYPSNAEIEKIGVRGIYLNNYIRWDSRQQHEKMIKKFNYEGMLQNRTFDFYSDPHCYVYNHVHDYFKYLKFGYGKINDHVSREIRLGHLSKQRGINLINDYLHQPPLYLDLFQKWLGLDFNGINFIFDQFRNNIFWKRDELWEWKFLLNYESTIGEDIYEFPYPKKFKQYQITKEYRSLDNKNEYILIGKGL